MKIFTYRHLAAASLLMAGVALGRAYTVEGCVMERKEGLNEVGVNILNTKGLLLASTFTDSTGKFLIPDLEDDQIVIDVTDERYAPQRFEVATGKADTDLGVIALEKATNLNELTVLGSSTFDAPGKTVVYVTPTERERATDAYNMLNLLSFKAPQIQVREHERSVTINGSTPQILVNGVKRSIDYISTIDQDLIEKIEFTTMPEIRFNNTYINIITKRTPQGGRVKAELYPTLTTERFGYGALGEYTRGKNSFMLYYGGNFRNGKKEFEDMKETYTAPDKTLTFTTEAKPSSTIDRSNNLSFEFTRIPSAKSMLTVTATLGEANQDRVSRGYVTDLYESYDRTNRRGWDYLGPSLDAYYQIQVSKTAILEFNAAGSYRTGQTYRNLAYSTGYDSRVSTDCHTWNIGGEALWRQKLPFAGLYTGISFNYNDSDNKYLIDGAKSAQTLSSTYLWAYTSMGGQLFTVLYNVSAAVCYYKTAQSFVYTNFTAALQKHFGNCFSIGYRFFYQPGMPSMSEYSDIITPVNDLMYDIGNDALKPQDKINNTLQLQFSKGKFYASLNGTAAVTSNPMVTQYSYDNDPESELYGYFTQRSNNLKKFVQYQASADLGISNLWNFLSFGANTGWTYSSYRDKTNLTVCSWYLSLRLGLYWKGWQLDVSGFNVVPHRSMHGLGTSKSWPSPSMTLSKKLGNWSLSASWKDMFMPYGTRHIEETIGGAFTSSKDYRLEDHGNLVCLSIIYQFSTGKSLNKKDRAVNASSSGNSGVMWNY